MLGRNKPIALGQVGIRCIHCRDDPISERGQQAVSYPSLISGIYNSVQQMLRLHIDCCLGIPIDVRNKIESLKKSSSSRGGRKQYWVDSAKRLGLVDTSDGIHFIRDPYGPLPALGGPSGACPKDNRLKRNALAPSFDSLENDHYMDGSKSESMAHDDPNKKLDLNALGYLPKDQVFPLVVPEDKTLISDYLYITLEQMQPCNLTEADKVGCYKGRQIGFPGLVGGVNFFTFIFVTSEYRIHLEPLLQFLGM